MALATKHEIKKIEGIMPEQDIIDLIRWADVVVSIDSFVPHLIQYHKINKKVVVIWGTSSPEIFGYTTNVNLLKGRQYLREQQFKWWKDEVPNPDAFVSPEIVLWEVENLHKNNVDTNAGSAV